MTMLAVPVLALAFMGTPLAAYAQTTEGSMSEQKGEERQDQSARESEKSKADARSDIKKEGSMDKEVSPAPHDEPETPESGEGKREGSH
ncbi:MAG: hypothetical protein ACRERD_04565 [Candidatus Binatia bacterium]